jgi:hypothetical protein
MSSEMGFYFNRLICVRNRLGVNTKAKPIRDYLFLLRYWNAIRCGIYRRYVDIMDQYIACVSVGGGAYLLRSQFVLYKPWLSLRDKWCKIYCTTSGQQNINENDVLELLFWSILHSFLWDQPPLIEFNYNLHAHPQYLDECVS